MARMGVSLGVARSARKTDQPLTGAGAGDVARVAYELFLRRGGVHGHDQEDWFEAERIVSERRRQTGGR